MHMNFQFCGAFFHMTEKTGTVIDFRLGVRYYMLMHFYQPMVLFVGERKIETKKDAWIVLRPQTPKMYYSAKGGFVNDYVFFLCENEKLFKRFHFPLDEVFYLNGGEDVADKIGLISWALTDVLIDHQELMSNTLLDIFAIFRDFHCSVSPRADRRELTENKLSALRHEVQLSPVGWSVEKMAQRMYLTRGRFTVVYKARFGVSPSDDLRMFLALYAEKLLTDSDMTLAEIAEHCCYANTENFIRFFRNYRHITPDAIRRRRRQPQKDDTN